MSGDALIEGSGIYKLFKDGKAIKLRTSRGRNFSDNSSRLWDVVKATRTDLGFQVLLQGEGRRSGRYKIWSTDDTGQILERSRWMTADQMLVQGFEGIFNLDFNRDGFTGEPPVVDEDGDGLIDNSIIYKILKDGESLSLTNSRGRTFSDNSSLYWNIERAIRTETGFQLLVVGEGKRSERYQLWSTDEAGQILKERSRWRTGDQMLALGYEEIFKYDFNGDGLIMQTIFGSDGNDTISGSNLSEVIITKQGADSIYSGEGADIVYAGQGDDVVFGGLGNDFIGGQRGDDIIFGGPGDDIIYGATGNDSIEGGFGNDVIYGAVGADTIYGGVSNDIITGGENNDKLFGGIGDDFVSGESGDDVIYGGVGADTLLGGIGSDTLTGGTGSDIFVQNDQDSFLYEERQTYYETKSSENNYQLKKGSKFTFTNVDVITDFQGGVGVDNVDHDFINTASANDLREIVAGGSTNDLKFGSNYWIRGKWSNLVAEPNVFTQQNDGDDALILLNAQDKIFEHIWNDNFIIAIGAGKSLIKENLVSSASIQFLFDI